MMRYVGFTSRLLAIATLLLGGSGCCWSDRPWASSSPGHGRTTASSIASADCNRPTDAEAFGSLAERLKVAAAPLPGNGPNRTTKALVLSGGGMYGAYVAGALSGWSASGTRPVFDVVTGVSTGGLIATYAFLGAEYDQRLADIYTNVRTKDVYRRRAIAVMLWSDAAASSAPLKRRIDAETTDELIGAVAAAHLAGRRLYVGTTNLDTGRLVVWDMGAIAASGRPDAKELYRNILLATSSVPGLLPPVPITVEIDGRQFTELHVDGGAVTGCFLRASELTVDKDAVRQNTPPLADSDAYVMVAGKLFPEPKSGRRTAIKIGAGSLDSLVASQMRGEIFRIYTLCQMTGMRFHVTSLPEQVPVSRKPMSFDPAQMRRLYDEGYELGASGEAWRHDLPDTSEPSAQKQHQQR